MLIRRKLLVFMFLVVQLAAFSQPQLEWQKVFGGTGYDLAMSMANTDDGGYILAGLTYSDNGDILINHGYADLLIVKLNATGNVSWQKSLGGSFYDSARCIKQTSDGGFIVAGQTNSTDGDAVGITNGSEDYWLVKLNAHGNIQWQNRYGGSSVDNLYSVLQTSDGGYIMAGASANGGGMVVGNHGNFDAWIVKVDQDGILIWQKSLGGSGDDVAKSVIALADGGYVVAGSTKSRDGDISLYHGFNDVWIVKLSEDGNIVWEKTYGGSQADIANSIIQTTDGGFVFVGHTSSNDGQVSGNHSLEGYNFFAPDFWVVKIDNSGILEWQKCLGGFNNEEAQDVLQTTDGGYIIVGSTETPANQEGDVTEGSNGGSDFWVVKLNSSGQLQWQKTLGGSDMDFANAITQASDGGFVIAGHVSSDDGDVEGMQPGHISDFWAVKLAAENLAVADFDKNNLIVYPNPTTLSFSIKVPVGFELTNLTIRDNMGKILLETKDANNVDMASFASGLYFITISSGKNSYLRKIIKK